MGLNWVFYKLREWVCTVTGKGDRWEGNSWVGPSPLFEWPAPPHSLHQPALHGKRPANFICWLAVMLRGLCRSDRLPAVFACSGLVLPACLPVHLCHALPATFAIHAHCPCPPAPVLFAFPAPCSLPCAPGSNQQFASCKTVLLAATTRACSGGPCAGF